MDIDALYKGMADADVNGRGGNTEVGLYKVEFLEAFPKKGQNPKKPGDSFIIKFKFVESSCPKHEPGSSGSQVLKFTWPATFGHITKFVFALLDAVQPGQWTATDANLKDKAKRETAEKYARALSGSEKAKQELGEMWMEGMFKGTLLNLETKKSSTSTGGEFTEYHWSAAR